MRSIWSGTISFGLVSVGVRMFPATESKELRFHFLDKRDLTPVGYEKVRKDDRKPVAPEDVVRGFEVDKGRYVEIGDEDLDRLDIELTHSIDICDFVSPDEVRNPASLDGDIGAAKLQKAEVEMAKALVENLSEPFKPEKYDATYRKELLELIRAKAKGQKLPEPEEEDEGEVVDLMTALRESVERTKKQRKRSSPKKRAKAS